MHLDPMMPYLVGAILAVLVLAIVLRYIRQPYVIGYLIAGVVLGPQGIALVEDEEMLARLGAIGVVLLLFFIGMEALLLSKPKRQLMMNLFRFLIEPQKLYYLP